MGLEVNALVLFLLLTFVNSVGATQEEFVRAEPGDVISLTYESIQVFIQASLIYSKIHLYLRTVPPIVSLHPFCASRETLPRARPRVSPDAYSMLTSTCKKNTPQRAVC